MIDVNIYVICKHYLIIINDIIIKDTFYLNNYIRKIFFQ